MSVATFDTLSYTKGAEKIGIKREHAEYQAEQMGKIVNDQLVNKSFLATQLKELEMKIIIKVGAMMFVQTGLIITIIGLLLRK
jgi:hypothetical protein